ncbi:carboxypeptidase-like regulatory domain-containing protein [Parapedobacter koreensis]|uniref:CarboxypepD_reg-like domain-containing protein n=1 Tax=Parapedobacter koreensis TaxID=332977 RepID=A0A1H7PFY4_9SPHI|nr:carboxypeptidase-like regulatory domain-containing protein [Parapedobacter koreensis]SEL34672.1 CarboxypepD_reg-like domain-containing protein [Parapedobacter koreensis]
MKNYVAILLLGGMAWATSAAAQQLRLTGRVVNAETATPVAGASIFINNTTYGTSSASNGSFELGGIAPGTYEVVVSSVGYHTHVTSIELRDSQSVYLPIKLKVKSTMLEEVDVVAFEKDGWSRWGRLFLETFIGTSPNASRTKLLNPEVLRFRHYRDEGYLEVMASEPLIIENRSLGYTIEYLLSNFRVDFRNRVNLYAGYPRFVEMTGGRRSLRTYRRRRAATYATSLMRFMRSLYQGTIREQGFEVRRMERKPNREKQRVQALQRTISKTDRYTQDSLAYFRKVMRQEDEFVTVFPDLLTVDSLLVDSADGRKKLVFEDYLYVQNMRLKEEPGYLRQFNETRKPGPQTSILLLYDSPYIWIERNGSHFPPQSLYTGWYWTWCDKVADLLPLDYPSPIGY